MPVPRTTFSAFLILLFCVPLAAQQPASATPSAIPRQRDPKAVTVIQRSLVVFGGTAQIEAMRDCTAEANFKTFTGSSLSDGTIVYKVAAGEYRVDSTTSEGTNAIGTGHGRPFLTASGTSKKLPRHVIRSIFSPVFPSLLLLKASKDLSYSLEYKGTGTIDSESVTIVQIASQALPFDSVATQQTWYFDTRSGLPSRIEYRMPDLRNPNRFTPASVDLSDYRSISGVLFPFQFTTSESGSQVEETHVASVRTNIGISPSEFDDSTGGAR